MWYSTTSSKVTPFIRPIPRVFSLLLRYTELVTLSDLVLAVPNAWVHSSQCFARLLSAHHSASEVALLLLHTSSPLLFLPPSLPSYFSWSPWQPPPTEDFLWPRHPTSPVVHDFIQSLLRTLLGPITVLLLQVRELNLRKIKFLRITQVRKRRAKLWGQFSLSQE